MIMRKRTHTFAEINLHDVVSEMLHPPVGFKAFRSLRQLFIAELLLANAL